MRVKTASYNLFALEREVRDALRAARASCGRRTGRQPRRSCGAGSRRGPPASCSPSARSSATTSTRDVLRVVLARAARSARLTTHFDLDFPRAPQRGPYWCHKHRRECRPVERAEHFLRRYALDTRRARRRRSPACASAGVTASVLHGDARELDLGGPLRRRRHVAAVPGPDRLPRAAPLRLRAARPRRPRRARARPRLDEGGGRAVRRGRRRRCSSARRHELRAGARVVVVVNDRRDLYPEILERAGLRLEHRLRRHVNRRTGRRAGEFFEDVLVAQKLSHSLTQRRHTLSPIVATCSHARSRTPRRSRRPPRRGRGAPPGAGARASRSSVSPTAPARRRSSA